LELKQQVPLTEPIPIHVDLRPTKQEQRTWQTGHFFSVWMGSVHNVPSYVTVGGFFALGLSLSQVFFTIMIAALILAGTMVLNGHAGARYGIPFSMLLKSVFGVQGAVLPGVLRGVIAAIMWFGLQTYAGSLAVTLLLGKIWSGYVTLGGDWHFLGLTLPQLLSFLLFWLIHVFLIFAGINTLGKLAKLLTPLIFLVFGGMAIWSIQLAGGIEEILSYRPKTVVSNNFWLMLTCIGAILSTWVAQMVSVADVTRFSSSHKAQTIGQIAGLLTTYLLFAFASISIIVGSEITFGVPIWNVLDVVAQFDNTFAILLALLTICLSTLSVNMVGNILPSGYQLAALFPNKLGFKSGAVMATVTGLLLMPWKLMENSTSIFAFLNMIGGLLSPVIGVMLVHYFIISNRVIEIDQLYQSTYKVNWPAVLSVLLAGSISILGKFVTLLEPLNQISWFTGIGLAMIFYLLLYYFTILLKKG
jgi:allantoin permease